MADAQDEAAAADAAAAAPSTASAGADTDALVSLQHVFGLSSRVTDCLWFKDDHSVMYPAGDSIVIYPLDQKVQQFVRGSEISQGITAMAVTSSRRYVAVAEKADRGVISVYDVVTLRRKRQLIAPDIASNEFISLAFSSDGKMLLALGGAPDYRVALFMWEKQKLVATVSAGGSDATPLYRASFNPADPSLVAVTGNGVFKLFRLVDNVFKQSSGGLSKREPQNYTCQVWASPDRLLIGTDSGEVIVVENGDFRLSLAQAPQDGNAITALVPHARGLVVCSSNATVHIYDRTEDKAVVYRRNKSLPVNDLSCGIAHAVLAPSEEYVAFVMENNAVLSLSLASVDLLKPEDPRNFESFMPAFHNGSVSCVATCVRKSLIATCGATDRTVKVWNYAERALEITHQFSDDVLSLSFHPSGQQLLVACTDKLRVMNLLLDSMTVFKEIAVRGCPTVSISRGGSLFAAVNHQTVQLFQFYTMANIDNLRGHSHRVTSLFWSPDDSRLVSAGLDGAVYRWNMVDHKREDEIVMKGCQLTSAVCLPDYSLGFACGPDRRIKVIANNQIKDDIDVGTVLTQLAVTSNGKVLFAGTQHGTIRVYRLPLSDKFTELLCHRAAVTKLAVSEDDSFLFSSAQDGTVAVLSIVEPGEQQRKREIPMSEEILVTKADLEEKTSLVTELQRKLDDVQMQHEYALKLRELDFQEKRKKVEEEYEERLDAVNQRFVNLQRSKADQERASEEQNKVSEERHKQQLQSIDQQFQRKIMAEMERYQALQQERDASSERFQEQQQLLQENHERMVEEMTDEYENRLNEDQMYIDQLVQEKAELMREFEETKRQLEEDADREIDDLKEDFEKKLQAERDAGQKLKTENVAMRKRMNALQATIDEKERKRQELEAANHELERKIAGLEQDIQGLKKEIHERDETIRDKEKRIFELKKKNQELEKFKFVLDYKIKELERQIEPRDQEIAELRQQIRDMDSDLVRYHKTKSALELKLNDMQLKVTGLQKDLHDSRQHIADQETVLRRIRADIHEVVQHLQDPKELKDEVRKLYEKHVSTGGREAAVGADLQREYDRQREFLERTVAALKTKLSKSEEQHTRDHQRVLQDNVTLIKEINDLRREVRLLRAGPSAAAGANGAGGRASKTGTLPSSALAQVDGAWPPEALREIEMQREEIARLRARVEELEAGLMTRPISRERLPPLDGFRDHGDT